METYTLNNLYELIKSPRSIYIRYSCYTFKYDQEIREKVLKIVKFLIEKNEVRNYDESYLLRELNSSNYINLHYPLSCLNKIYVWDLVINIEDITLNELEPLFNIISEHLEILKTGKKKNVIFKRRKTRRRTKYLPESEQPKIDILQNEAWRNYKNKTYSNTLSSKRGRFHTKKGC